MDQFTPDNTAGYSDFDLAALNAMFYHKLAIAVSELPDGAEGADDDTLTQIKQSLAEAVLADWHARMEG
jgi:hypothetical protein